MLFSDVLGHEHIKRHLIQSVKNGRIPHAQLFVGPEGTGTLPMAIAYARHIIAESQSKNREASHLKLSHLTHPDLHFVFPVAANQNVKSHPVSKLFLTEWRQLVLEQPYCNLYDWYKTLGVENKQGQIGVDEAQDIVKTLALKSFEGGYKVMIIWMAEKMNIACSNKLLKLIEEPPEKTVLLLVVEDEEQLLTTISSRCQRLHFAPLPEAVITDGLQGAFDLEAADAMRIARQTDGNYNKAVDLVYRDTEEDQFQTWFVHLVRHAFKAKGNKSAIHALMSWSEEIARTGRETQKQFLQYCLEVIRQALLINYNASELVYLEVSEAGFDLNKFAPFVHEGNIMALSDDIQDAIYHIERNGNAKIILTDLSIKMTRHLHKKSA